MSCVNAALPVGALPSLEAAPSRDACQRLGYPVLLNASEALVDTHLRAGRANRPALHHNGMTWTYVSLAKRVARLANALTARGLRSGDRVLIALPNVPEFVVTWLAVLRLGAVAVATLPLLRRHELEFVLGDAEPRALVTTSELFQLFSCCSYLPEMCVIVGEEAAGQTPFEDFLAAGSSAHRAAPTTAEDVAILAYTSGSTGQPKGTIHTHADILAIADTYARQVLRPSSDDRFAGHPSLGFTFGLGSLLIFPFRFGASSMLESSKFDPDKWIHLIKEFRATRFFTTPTGCRLFLQQESWDCLTWASVRTVVSAGQHLPAETFLQWRERSGTELLDGCGSTEMLHIWISQRSNDAVPGCTGRPVSLYEAKLLNSAGEELDAREAEGCVAVRGPTGCRYWRRPDLQRKAVQHGWTLSGDIFRRDGMGRYWYIGRTDDIINSGGYKIAPTEVETALLKHPNILDVAVVGLPDELRGQIIKAFIILKNNVGERTSDEAIRVFLKTQIAVFKCPHQIEYVSALPRTASGKIARHELRAIGSLAPQSAILRDAPPYLR